MHRHLEGELLIRRIGKSAARIEIAPRGPSDRPAGSELPRKVCRQDARANGALLQRCGVVVKIDEAREDPPDLGQKRAERRPGLVDEVGSNAARHDPVHHQPMPEREC